MEPIRYVDKLNKYYRDQGFPPFRWTIFESAPLKPLDKPLSQCTVTLLTTGGVSERSKPGFDPNAKNDHRLDAISSDVASSAFQIHDNYYNHSDAEKDINCIFPVDRLRELEAEGRIGRVAPRVWSGFMGRIYDRTRLTDVSAPEFVRELRKDGVDVLIAVAACPLDHQTAGLVCRVVEESGVSTVCLGTARDIMDQVKAPRSIFVNNPLGNNFGKAHDRTMQREILGNALVLVEQATVGGTLRELSDTWREAHEYDI